MNIDKDLKERLAFISFYARIFIGVLFFYSGFSKLIQPAEYFEIAVRQYELFPDSTVRLISLIVPWIELFFSTGLLLGYLLTISASILMSLAGLFQIIIAQALLRKLPIDECGCFAGGFIHLSLYQSFMLDTILFLVLVQIFTSKASLYSIDNWLNRSSIA